MVLYCLLRRWDDEQKVSRFLLMEKQSCFTFPCTKLRENEDLYRALLRPLDENLKIVAGAYFIEEELPMIPSSGKSERHPDQPSEWKQWFLYPLVVSYDDEALDSLPGFGGKVAWMTADEILDQIHEPNVVGIADFIKEHRSDLILKTPSVPSMDALACAWSAYNNDEVRIVRKSVIETILAQKSHAFNLRVADPYLSYQKQGLGFTWSFFSPKDKRDLHVHGLPSVEIYGVINGELILWHKPMNQRGIRSWRCKHLRSGDWAEVGPLQCHYAH